MTTGKETSAIITRLLGILLGLIIIIPPLAYFILSPRDGAGGLRPLLLRSGLLLLCLLPAGAAAFVLLRGLIRRARLRDEEALRRERDTAMTYLDRADVMLVVIDADQKVAFINKKGCEILRHAAGEILHQNWYERFVPARYREGLKAEFSRLKGASQARGGSVEYSVTTGSGDERIIAWHDVILRDEEGRFAGTLNSGEDITERRQLEAQLRHSQKMDAIGILAGGIAHDFNNILAAIIGFAGMMQMKMRKEDPMLRSVEQILASCTKATELVKSLLAFSRHQILDPKPVQVNDLVRRMETSLGSLLGPETELKTMLAYDDMTIQAEEGQLELVLTHLATNARDAMPDGGLLLIKTGTQELDENFIMAHGYGVAGDYTCIAVSDTGTGMTEQLREKIFEPFFTTKEVGKGTGLGLSIVYGIVKQHGGFIDVSSEPGNGTTFSIYLPLLRPARRAKDRNTSSLSAGRAGALSANNDDAASPF